MKKFLPFLFLFISAGLFSQVFFSGESGFSTDFVSSKVNDYYPEFYFQGYLAGQLNISREFCLRSELSLQSQDFFQNRLTKEVDSTFRFNELSASYVKSFLGATHTLSFFGGYSESIGSQLFIKRRLGMVDYSSGLTKNYLGLNSGMVYQVYGMGGSYSITFRQLPLSLGLEVSHNPENYSNTQQLNADFRMAFSNRYFTIDSLAGVGAPLYTKNDAGEDVFLLIDTLYYHCGFDVLVGNQYNILSLYGQYGFEYLPIRSGNDTKKLSPEDIYILFEPRLNFNIIKIHISGWNMPVDTVKKMKHIKDTLGANICIFSDKLYTDKRNFTLGMNVYGGLTERNFSNAFDDMDSFTDDLNIDIAPYTEIECFKGLLYIGGRAGLMKLKNKKADALTLSIGYKKEL